MTLPKPKKVSKTAQTLPRLEHDIQNDILKYLKSIKVKYLRINSGSVRHNTKMAVKGTPDIIACLYGNFIMIEVKQVGKVPTEVQKQCMREWEKCGAVCFVARSVQDVKDVLFKKHRVKEFELTP